MRQISIAVFALIFTICLQARAQTSAQSPTQSANELEMRLGRTLDSAMKTVAARTALYNARIAEMNKAKPLEVASFDSAHLAANASQTLQFLDFLKKYRDAGNTLVAAFEDSMFVIASDFPPVKERDRVTDFAAAFKADQQAFDAHLAGMTTLYSDVLNVLLFMQRTKYTVSGTKLSFSAKTDVAEYQKLMSAVDAVQKELAKTGAASRKATLNANARLQALNNASAEAAGQDPPKKKKK